MASLSRNVLLLVAVATMTLCVSSTKIESESSGNVIRHFSVLSRPMKLKYGEVHNTVQDPVMLPENIRAEFADGKPIAIVDYNVDIVSYDENGNEFEVPLYDGYNHHYLMVLGKYDTMKKVYDGRKDDPYGGFDDKPSSMSMQQMQQKMVSLAKEADGRERAAYFGGGSGAEDRGTSHKLPSPYAFIVDKPEAIMPLIHLINTKDNSTAGEGYSPLLECPCTPQRTFDLKKILVDGRPPIPPYSCNLKFEEEENPSCSIQTYQGGFRCCEHGVFVIDTDQYDIDQLPETTFYFKFTFEYTSMVPQVTLPVRPPACCDVTANLTVGGNIEYDVPLCTEGTPPKDCVHEMVSTQFFDLMSNYHHKEKKAEEGDHSEDLVSLVYAVGHLHVGGLSLDLYDDETGELICHSEPTYGDGLDAGNEKGYLVGMSDCVFDPPRTMKRGQVVRTVARYNNTINHHGVMALWLMQVSDPLPDLLSIAPAA